MYPMMLRKEVSFLPFCLLFIYINTLFIKLQKVHDVCYTRELFFGMMGYADDVIVLAPSVLSMNVMLKETREFGKLFDEKFNPKRHSC